MSKISWALAPAIAMAMITAAGCTSGQGPSIGGSSSPATGATTVTSPASQSSAPAPSASPTTTQALPAADFTVCTNPVVSCADAMRTEPTSIEISADGSGYVSGITWSDWGAASANGTGTLNVDNCVPNCAQGTFTGYPATISVWQPTPYGNGLQAYAMMVVASAADHFGQTYSNLAP